MPHYGYIILKINSYIKKFSNHYNIIVGGLQYNLGITHLVKTRNDSYSRFEFLPDLRVK